MFSSTILPVLIASRSAPFTTPAAAICSSTTPPGPCCATRTSARNPRSAVTIQTACRNAMRGSPTRRSQASLPTWRSPCIPVGEISAPPSSHRGLTILSPSSCSAIPISTAISSNMTASAPAASSRCGFSRKARSSSCSASSPQKAASLRTKARSSAASTRRQNTSRPISFACRRNAALRPQRRATSSPDEQWAKLRLIVEIAADVWG